MLKGDWTGTKIDSIPKRHIFLYELINPNSKVLIYGLGNQGKDYIKQIEATGYCTVSYISDSDLNKANEFNYAYIDYSNIDRDIKVDYLIIAIDDNFTASRIFWDWVDKGIEEKKIINIYLRQNLFPLTRDVVYEINNTIQFRRKTATLLEIAVVIKGGIGDNIISLSFIRRLKSICDEVFVDIYSDQEMMEAVFGAEEYVRSIYIGEAVIIDKYDVVFRLRQLIHVQYADMFMVNKISHELAELIISTKERREKEGLQDEKNRDINILKRAKMLRCDRFEMLGDQNNWNLSNSMSFLTVNDKYKNEFRGYNLNKYITIHTGSGTVPGHSGESQTKEWTYKYYETLVQKIKLVYPGIKVVQIGGAETIEVKGVDRVISGIELEIVKHILKNSFLHIDGEGGMVHLATQLGTKCLVLFGPTPMDYYGYPQNINIKAGNCDGCMGISPDWYTKCPLYDEPICMKAITPEMVLEKASDYLKDVLGKQ